MNCVCQYKQKALLTAATCSTTMQVFSIVDNDVRTSVHTESIVAARAATPILYIVGNNTSLNDQLAMRSVYVLPTLTSLQY